MCLYQIMVFFLLYTIRVPVSHLGLVNKSVLPTVENIVQPSWQLATKHCSILLTKVECYRRDTYANMVCTLADIRFEIVSVLYNIGALHSQLGAADTRTTSEGLKLSCSHFQCAAWAFQVICLLLVSFFLSFAEVPIVITKY